MSHISTGKYDTEVLKYMTNAFDYEDEYETFVNHDFHNTWQ